MKTSLITLALLAAVVATPVAAQKVDPASDLGRFHALRAEGMAALQKNDRQTALDRLTQAGEIIPDSPSVLLLRAQAALELKRRPVARAALIDYLTRGLVLDLGRYPEFNTLWDADLESLQAENTRRIGSLSVLHRVEGLNLIEGVAAMDDGTLLGTSLRNGAVGPVSAAGIDQRLSLRAGVAANAIALKDGALWASTAASRQTVGYAPDAKVVSKIIKVDPATGKIRAQFEDKRPDRRLSDLHAGKEDLYVSDGNTGEVLRLTGYQGPLQVLIPEGYLGSPQGLSENADATVLIVADYASGLYRIDLTTGTLARLKAPADTVLLGLDGLYRYGNDLIAVQNGFKPNRILRLKMNADWSAVETTEVLLRGQPELEEPTGGQVIGDRFVFVARSQWSEFDDKGNIKRDTPAPVVIGEIKLKP
ncbi:hypothetical protein [Asticcacaulis sp. AND118]|uniref:hypothetical protein n=1 Tax=Asticcacaulis sp. AND118 TaxID=2840468 RepID=UPI001CFF8A4D|nr:hypothetical protein [Asticcacaulis sp. AND118]UDF03950.1 hypothetical protein LH365_02605 [Asticcacaulis sp. AND118]